MWFTFSGNIFHCYGQIYAHKLTFSISRGLGTSLRPNLALESINLDGNSTEYWWSFICGSDKRSIKLILQIRHKLTADKNESKLNCVMIYVSIVVQHQAHHQSIILLIIVRTRSNLFRLFRDTSCTVNLVSQMCCAFVVAVLFKMQIGDEKHEMLNQGMKTDINAQWISSVLVVCEFVFVPTNSVI